jgi:Initiator Replication protein
LLQLKKEFTTYRLKNVMELKSGYSIRIYEILKRWQFINDVEIPLDDLRKMVGATDKYLEYHNFKKRVLAPAQKEISAKTDLAFAYKEVKSGRKVVAIRFFIRERRVGGKGVVPEIPHETGGVDALYSQCLARFAERGQPLPPKAFARIALLSQKVFGEDWIDELTKMIDDVVERTDIREPLAFLTYVLNEKIDRIEKGQDHSEVSVEKIEKAMRREKLPDWFAEYQKQFLQDMEQNSAHEDGDIERRRSELEARLQKYRN